jgi:hypothetical protein
MGDCRTAAIERSASCGNMVHCVEIVQRIEGPNDTPVCDLGPLSETAAGLNRWDFLLIVAPIPMPRATGYIVDPLAMF